MSQIKKYFAYLQKYPTDVKIKEFLAFLEHLGFKCFSNGKNNHFTAKREDVIFSIPNSNGLVKRAYVKQVVDYLETQNLIN